MLGQSINQFEGMESNVSTTRPNTSGWGTTIVTGTSGALAASYTQLIASTSFDTYFLRLQINYSTTQYPASVRIGIGPAGSEIVLIPDLLCCAPATTVGQGIQYCFPIFIPAGSRISANGRTQATSSSAPRVAMQIYGKPSRPEQVAYGTYIDAVGLDVSLYLGTPFVPGETSEGNWYALTSATTRPYWWINAAYAKTTNASWAATACIDIDVGNTTKVFRDSIIKPLYWPTKTIEYINDCSISRVWIPTGTALSIRGQSNTGRETDMAETACIYLLGGGNIYGN